MAQRLRRPAGPELVRLIHDRSDGVPFIIEALADAVAGEFTGRAGSVDAGPHPPCRTASATPVLLRLEVLSPAAAGLAGLAAAAGMRIAMEVAVQLSDEDTDDELCDSGLLGGLITAVSSPHAAP